MKLSFKSMWDCILQSLNLVENNFPQTHRCKWSFCRPPRQKITCKWKLRGNQGDYLKVKIRGSRECSKKEKSWYMFLCVLVWRWWVHLCHDASVEISGHPWALSSPCTSFEIASHVCHCVCQAAWGVSLPDLSSHHWSAGAPEMLYDTCFFHEFWESILVGQLLYQLSCHFLGSRVHVFISRVDTGIALVCLGLHGTD